MRYVEITKNVGLEDKHFELKELKVPVIQSGIYTTLGRRLFELYQKYSIEASDQRQLENLSFVLTAFTLDQENKTAPRSNWLRRFFGKVRGR